MVILEAKLSSHAKSICTRIPEEETGKQDRNVSAHRRVEAKRGKSDLILQEQKPVPSYFSLLAEAV